MIPMSGRRLSGFLFLMGLIVSAPDALGQVASPWIGRKVITKYRAPLAVAGRGADPDHAYRVYTVEKAQGRWLRLASDQVSGWALVSQVVPLERAIAFYTKEIRNSPRPSRAYVQRGLIWGDQGENNRAIADYTQAIRLDSSDAEAFERRATAWMDKKEYEIALADLTDVIRLRPRDFRAYLDRGLAWERKGDLDRAIADFTESLRHEPENPWAYNNRGNARRAKGEFDRAIADYGEALALEPGFILAYINRGLAWGAKEDYERAIDDEDRAIRLDPKNAFAYNNRAIFHARKGRYDKAIADFTESLRLDPQLQAARSGLALMLASCPDAKFRDGKRAVELATEAYRGTRPEEPIFCSALAAAYAEAGDFARAVELQERALQLTLIPDEREELRARLSLYEEKKPYRQEPSR
jgi:tetratricopeptide (TPR) repeat protein